MKKKVKVIHHKFVDISFPDLPYRKKRTVEISIVFFTDETYQLFETKNLKKQINEYIQRWG